MPFLFPIDIYCERTDIGFWNEPVNALSNAAFFIAAALLYKIYAAKGVKDRASALLIAMLALVGVGSFLFHTFAVQLTMMADVASIGLFVICYLWIALRRTLGTTRRMAAIGVVGLLAAILLTDRIPEAYHFNGSIPYFPCLITVMLLAAALRKTPVFNVLIFAAGCFMLSLTFRSLDMALCPALPIGTHFLWHILNGVALYALTRAVLVFPRATAN